MPITVIAISTIATVITSCTVIAISTIATVITSSCTMIIPTYSLPHLSLHPRSQQSPSRITVGTTKTLHGPQHLIPWEIWH